MKNSKHDDLCQVSSSKVDYTGLLIEQIHVGLEQKSLELHPPKCKIEKINKKKGLRLGKGRNSGTFGPKSLMGRG